MSNKRVHFNIPQLKYWIVRAHTTIARMGRATGKTEGPGALFTAHNATTMPRSLGGLVSVTYDKLITPIVPKLIKSWEKLGYYQDHHFWVRKFAPPHLRREKPYLPVQDAKHFIHWWNGSGQVMISLDRLGISNAYDLDYIYADEAKLFDYDKFREVILANRGNAEHFGHLAEHHSMLITTDLPKGTKGQWLFEYDKQMDKEQIELIMRIERQLYTLQDKFEKATKKQKVKIARIIRTFEAELNELRRDAVYILEASTLDNVHALGIDTIADFYRNLSETDYTLSVLNEMTNAAEIGFYPALDEDHHGYTSYDYDYVSEQEIGAQRDCRWDSDILPNEPLDIAFDHNAAINSLVTGQEQGNIYRFLNSQYVLHPQRLKHLLDNWCTYYQHHKEKTVYYYFDHTSIPDDASRDLPYSDEIIQYLRNRKWNVKECYIGQQPRHKARYEFWGDILNESDDRLPKFRYNKSNALSWKEAAEGVGIRYGHGRGKDEGFTKDKGPEKDKDYPQEKAPHLTDAGDTLLWGKLRDRVGEKYGFVDIRTY